MRRAMRLLNGLLKDKIADDNKELKENTFAEGFLGGITDLDFGNLEQFRKLI
jgi:hypothetical protein